MHFDYGDVRVTYLGECTSTTGRWADDERVLGWVRDLCERDALDAKARADEADRQVTRVRAAMAAEYARVCGEVVEAA